MRRVLVFELHQESDTFNPIVMKMDRFTSGKADEGKEAYDILKTLHGMATGMINAVEDEGGEVIPTIFLHAASGGKVDDAVLTHTKERLKYYIETAGEFDAVCAALHGAMVMESADDGCGNLLEYLRELVGNKPIAAAFDLHANITEKIKKNADIICGYQTYPHLDIYETGYRAAKLCMQKLNGKDMTKAIVSVPMLVPPSGFTNLEEPFKSVIDTGNAMLADNTLLDYTVFVVQPWLDVKEISSTVVAIAEDEETAKEKAQLLAKMLFEKRDEYMPNLLAVEEVIAMAEDENVPKPVIMSDAADSPNGGAVGDSPYLALKVRECGSNINVGMFVVDPKAVQHAFEVGVGNKATFSIGAAFTPGMPGPFVEEGKVCSLHDGFFPLGARLYRNNTGNMGRCALINFGNIDILVTEKCSASGSPQLFRHFGIQPEAYDLIDVKANTSFIAPYSKFAGVICYGDTPGAGAANLKRFEWKHIPKGLYPFDLPEGYEVEKAKVY